MFILTVTVAHLCLMLLEIKANGNITTICFQEAGDLVRLQASQQGLTKIIYFL